LRQHSYTFNEVTSCNHSNCGIAGGNWSFLCVQFTSIKVLPCVTTYFIYIRELLLFEVNSKWETIFGTNPTHWRWNFALRNV
jgi:hypothetical protein